MYCNAFIKAQVALNKTRLVLKIILQNTQTLQLFTKITKSKVFTKVPSWMAWVQRPSGVIKIREEAQAL